MKKIRVVVEVNEKELKEYLDAENKVYLKGFPEAIDILEAIIEGGIHSITNVTKIIEQEEMKCPFKRGCCCQLKEFAIYGAECSCENKYYKDCLVYQSAKKGIKSEEG